MKKTREVSVFIASSNELSGERLLIGAWFNEFDNRIEASDNIRLRLRIWEDYNNCFDGRRTQDHYNKELVKDSDVFIVLLQNRYGEFTNEEIEYSTKYSIRHRLAIFIPDGTTVEPSDAWKKVLSVNRIQMVIAQSPEEILAAIKKIINVAISDKHLPKENKPLRGTLIYATVSDDLPDGKKWVRNIVRQIDEIAEKINKPRLYLFPYHTKEEIKRSHHYFGFVGSSADATAEEEIRTAIKNATPEWTPTLYLKRLDLFRQTPLGKYICEERQYFVPSLDNAYRRFESNLKDILLSREIRYAIYKNVEIFGNHAFILGLEIDDYGKLMKDSSLLADLKKLRNVDKKNLTTEELTFYDELILGRVKTVISVRIQLKNLILEEIRYFCYIGLSSKFADLINSDNIAEWYSNSKYVIEVLEILQSSLEKDKKKTIHLLRLKALLYLWQSKNIPASLAQKIRKNAESDYEDAQILLFTLHFSHNNYNQRKTETYKRLEFFFEKASDNTNPSYNLQSGLDALEAFIDETETNDVVVWLDYFKSYYGRITEHSTRSDLLYCRLITAYLRRLSNEEDSEELIEKLKIVINRLWLKKDDILPEDLTDFAYVNSIAGAYYVDRFKRNNSDEAVSCAKSYMARAYEIITKFYEIDKSEAAPFLSLIAHNIGWLYYNLNNKSEACKYYEKAYKIRKLMLRTELLTNSDFLLAETAINYSSVLLDLNRIDEALDKAEIALKLRRSYKYIQEENHQAYYMIALQIFGFVLLRVPNRYFDGISSILEVYNWNIAHPNSKWHAYFEYHSGDKLRQLGII